jgi:glucan phosphoethanolaminetransferase (alkaline phosphatase superfamily)
MVSWIFIGLIIAAIFLFFKITSFRYERWWTYLIAILLIFMLFSFFNVSKSNNLDLNSFDGFVTSAKAYSYWLVNFGKAAASITGKASNLNWSTSNNSTIIK